MAIGVRKHLRPQSMWIGLTLADVHRHGGTTLQCNFLKYLFSFTKLNLHKSHWTGGQWVPRSHRKRLQSRHTFSKPILQSGAMWDTGRYGQRPPITYICFTYHLDFRTQLSATDYGNFLANEPLPISTSTIADKATGILVDQFNYIRNNAVQPLAKFLDYITYASRSAPHDEIC